MTNCKCHYCWEGEQKGSVTLCFHSSCRFSNGASCSESLISTGRNDRSMPSELLNLIGCIGKSKAVFNIIAFIFIEQHFFKRRAFLLSRPLENGNCVMVQKCIHALVNLTFLFSLNCYNDCTCYLQP